jgi:glycosyltransferase involved in cell wall biosynthesis
MTALPPQRSIWITWERQRRNRSMAASVGATLHELEYNGNAIARYCVLISRTVRLVRSSKPEVIFFQNPSLVLAALIAALKALGVIRCKTVGDFHNAGVHPPTATFLVPWIVRHCDLVLVSNSNLASTIEAAGGRCLAVPDPLPNMAHATDGSTPYPPAEGAAATSNSTGPLDATSHSTPFFVLFVCSWASDEPIVAVLQAARTLQDSHPNIKLAITGRPKLSAVGWTGTVPGNVELTGFLKDEDFERRLASCSVILDLTTRADCMVCGAYEAVSVGVPMILSNNEPTMRYFHKGALYTDNTAASIAQLIIQAHARHAQLKQEVMELKDEIAAAEKETLAGLWRSLPA